MYRVYLSTMYGSCPTARSVMDYRRCLKRLLNSPLERSISNFQKSFAMLTYKLTLKEFVTWSSESTLHHWKGKLRFFNIVWLEVLDIRYDFTFFWFRIIWYFPYKYTKRRMLLMEQEMLSLPVHTSSSPASSRDRVA